MGDSLGDRMKMFETISRTRLVRRIPALIRLDGKPFHSFTKQFERPYDVRFHAAMWGAAQYLCENIQGCRLAYVQSDEITLLLTDWDSYKTDAWFDYQVQKMTSVAASLCTGGFVRALAKMPPGFDLLTNKTPAFDARVWNLPRHEVTNCLIWRQQDASRNSLDLSGDHVLRGLPGTGRRSNPFLPVANWAHRSGFRCFRVDLLHLLP